MTKIESQIRHETNKGGVIRVPITCNGKKIEGRGYQKNTFLLEKGTKIILGAEMVVRGSIINKK